MFESNVLFKAVRHILVANKQNKTKKPFLFFNSHNRVPTSFCYHFPLCKNMKHSMANLENKDLFMDLPECLLRLIISFLPFKEAARTSVLSKQWLNIWHRTTNIEFEEGCFVDPEESEPNKAIRRTAFVNFASEWVRNYFDPAIDKLCVSLSKPGQFANDVERFISFAVSKNAKRLSLVFSDPETNEPCFDLPSSVYNHGILESLVLFSCKMDISGFKNLRLLKELSLGWIELKEKSIKILLKHCPFLEILSLTKCWNIERFVMNKKRMENLKKLAIENCSFSTEPIWIYVENAPKLHFFKYTGKAASFDLDYLKSMQEVELDFGLEEGIRSDSGDLICNLILQLFSVTKLTVCSFMLQVYITIKFFFS